MIVTLCADFHSFTSLSLFLQYFQITLYIYLPCILRVTHMTFMIHCYYQSLHVELVMYTIVIITFFRMYNVFISFHISQEVLLQNRYALDSLTRKLLDNIAVSNIIS